MPRYFVQSAHTPEECLNALDAVLAQGSAKLAAWDFRLRRRRRPKATPATRPCKPPMKRARRTSSRLALEPKLGSQRWARCWRADPQVPHLADPVLNERVGGAAAPQGFCAHCRGRGSQPTIPRPYALHPRHRRNRICRHQHRRRAAAPRRGRRRLWPRRLAGRSRLDSRVAQPGQQSMATSAMLPHLMPSSAATTSATSSTPPRSPQASSTRSRTPRRSLTSTSEASPLSSKRRTGTALAASSISALRGIW